MNPEKEKKRARDFIISVIAIMAACLYVGLHLGNAMYLSQDPEGTVDLMDAVNLLLDNIINPLAVYPTNWYGVLLSIMVGSILCLYRYMDYIKQKNTMDGEEYGSASFNTDYKKLMHDYVMSPKFLINRELDRKGIEDKDKRKKKQKEMEKSGKYAIDENFKSKTGRKVCKTKKFDKEDEEYCKLQSQVYAKNVYLSLDTSMTQLNLNTIVFGGSGAGKSRFFVKPNLLQANSSYVVTDPSGELMMSCGKFLEDHGYTIKCLNLEDMSRSNRYNPFAYVYENSDIPVMVEALIKNIQGKKAGGGTDPFWDQTSKTLLIAICGYLFETQTAESGQRNFYNVMKLLEMADVSEDSEGTKSDLDLLFDDLEQADPESYAVSQYKIIKQVGSGKTAQNIIISTTSIFGRFFLLDKIINLTYKDEIHLEEIGQKKCALFIVTPQGDTTYNFLASLLYTQLFATLYKQGEDNAKKTNSANVTLKVPVRCLIDEAANIGEIPQFTERLATMRKYGISACPIYQNQAQVKELFKDSWETIVGNCDTMLFLGGIDSSTVKMVSERLGKGTISTNAQSSSSTQKNSGINKTHNDLGRELMTTTEIEQMDNTKCITFIRSMKPFLDLKYPYQNHPNYKYTGDADEDNNYYLDSNLHYDRNEILQILVKKTTDPGYSKPQRKSYVSDEDIENKKKEQNKMSAPKSFKVNQSVPLSTVTGLDLSKEEPDFEEMEKYEDKDSFDETLIENLKNNEYGRELLKFIS